MRVSIHRAGARLLVVGMLLLILLGIGGAIAPVSQAAVQRLEEAPGQVLYQSRQKLRDGNGHTWQAIAFKRIQATGEPSVKLRLVGFPGEVELRHPQPLKILLAQGNVLTAADVSAEPFTDQHPAGHIGQYDLTPVIDQLPAFFQIALVLTAVDGTEIRLGVSPLALHEWQDVAAARDL
ncbi:MAG: DUF3122 domain-containing protein [Synechococcales bacterium]|nr:DUF3122 domain-containing protein [Synechococcales bacterium]